jgi:hypothetical protein
MLLGQLVAVSFATNLYLLTILLTPPPPPPPSPKSTHQGQWLGPWLINLLSVVLTIYPAYQLADEHYWYHQKDFMPMVLTPHIALLIMPLLRAVVPRKYLSDSSVGFAGTAYRCLWAANGFGGALLLTRITVLAHGYSGAGGIWRQLWEHPAVSSVAFDVIFCWITWATWWALQAQIVGDRSTINVKVEHHSEGTGIGSGRTDAVPEKDSLRRR